MTDPGPLTRTVFDYTQTMERLLPAAKDESDWGPLANFVAVDQFERVGTFMEVQNWHQYVELLTRWATTTEKFETTVRRVSELPGLVYFEIEERHLRDHAIHVANSLTVFEFNGAGEIRHLDVYLQQAR